MTQEIISQHFDADEKDVIENWTMLEFIEQIELEQGSY